MAKDAHGRVRFFYADFEGDSQTIQTGLQAIASAIKQSTQPRVIKALPPQSEQNPPNRQQTLPLEDPMPDEYDELEDGEIDVSTKKSQHKTKRKAPTMTLVKELDLRPEGQAAWRAFSAEKNPDSQQEKVAVAVYYLCRILEAEGVTPHHVFTCFKDVGWRVPSDLPQIIRNTANRTGWVNSSDSKNITITNIGENCVEHDLPGSGE